MKEIADMKGVVGIIIKIATFQLLEVFRIRDINKVNIHSSVKLCWAFNSRAMDTLYIFWNIVQN
jgi:hypothetical protein